MSAVTRLLCLSTALGLCAFVPAHAVTCHIRTSPMSPGDIEMAHGHWDKAETLYAAEGKAATAAGEADRVHAALIRAELRQSKVAEAEKDAEAWAAAARATQPKNAWPLEALAEVEWREGKPDDAIHSISAAEKADPCNPEVHVVLATLYRMAGLYASASKQLTVARQLDPVDDDIESDWMRLQPRSVQLTEVTKYLARSTFLSDDERKSLNHWKDQLSGPIASSCRLVTPVTSAKIPFRAIQHGPQSRTYWGLDVGFNGKGRTLEIDTGASGLILTKGAARALHLTPERQFKAGGIGDDGDVDSFVAKVASIKIGSLEFQDCDVQVLGSNPAGMSDQDGLIGGDVFSRFLLTLDFPGQTLKLDWLPARPGESSADASQSLATGVSAREDTPQDAYKDPSMKDWTGVWRSGHDLLMPVGLQLKGPNKLFLLDTGSAMDLISPEAAREVGKVSKGSWITLMGISGEVKKTWTTGPMTLYFSHIAAPSQGLLAIETTRLGKGTGVEVSGVIGAPTLHQLTFSIDYRDNLVNFSYDPKRVRRCVAGINIADCY